MTRRWIIYLTIVPCSGLLISCILVSLNFSLRDVSGYVLGETDCRVASSSCSQPGVWLVPVVPIALFEAQISRSRLRSTVASISVWCIAIVAYYLTNAGYLFFWGYPAGRDTSPAMAPHTSGRTGRACSGETFLAASRNGSQLPWLAAPLSDF